MIVKFFENRVDKPKQGPIVGPRHGLAKIKIQFWTGAKQPCVFLLPKSRQKFSTTRSCDSPGPQRSHRDTARVRQYNVVMHAMLILLRLIAAAALAFLGWKAAFFAYDMGPLAGLHGAAALVLGLITVPVWLATWCVSLVVFACSVRVALWR